MATFLGFAFGGLIGMIVGYLTVTPKPIRQELTADEQCRLVVFQLAEKVESNDEDWDDFVRTVRVLDSGRQRRRATGCNSSNGCGRCSSTKPDIRVGSAFRSHGDPFGGRACANNADDSQASSHASPPFVVNCDDNDC